MDESARAIEDKNVNFFPDLPSYSDPTSGAVSHLPLSWIPYAQLMRLDRPAGLYAIYVPYLIGTAYAACITQVAPTMLTVMNYGATFLPFSILLRGVACTWNDNIDQNFDRRVKRCRHRPIARGAVSTTQANIFTIAQLAIGYVFMKSRFNAACMPHITAIVLLSFVYAPMKRVTHYPQIVLGFPLAWAIFFSVAAFGIDPLSNEHGRATVALFFANIFWTIIYDTVYAHQDVADDEKAGVKGMALRFEDSTKLLASLLSAGQISLLAICGMISNFGPLYFVGAVGGTTVSLAYFIQDVDLKQPGSCAAWFHKQFWLVGGSMLMGLFGEYVSRLTK